MNKEKNNNLERLIIEKFIDRLIELLSDAKKNDPSFPGIAVNSLINLLKLFRWHKINFPKISLLDNSVYLVWGEKKERLTLHLLPTGFIKVVIFSPNNRPVSGITTIELLIETISQHNVLDRMFRYWKE